jgi:hypothetical protein
MLRRVVISPSHEGGAVGRSFGVTYTRNGSWRFAQRKTPPSMENARILIICKKLATFRAEG